MENEKLFRFLLTSSHGIRGQGCGGFIPEPSTKQKGNYKINPTMRYTLFPTLTLMVAGVLCAHAEERIEFKDGAKVYIYAKGAPAGTAQAKGGINGDETVTLTYVGKGESAKGVTSGIYLMRQDKQMQYLSVSSKGEFSLSNKDTATRWMLHKGSRGWSIMDATDLDKNGKEPKGGSKTLANAIAHVGDDIAMRSNQNTPDLLWEIELVAGAAANSGKGEKKTVFLYNAASKLYLNANGFHVNKPESRVATTTFNRAQYESWTITYTGEKAGSQTCTIEINNKGCGVFKYLSVPAEVKAAKDSKVIGKMEISLSDKPMEWSINKSSKGTTINLAHAGGYVVSVTGEKKNCVLGWNNATPDQLIEIKEAK